MQPKLLREKTSNDILLYILRDLLHKYANEDVSLGSWFIGLNVEHVNDKRLCCSTSPEGKLILVLFMFGLV